jgi:hypothetical protein
VTGEDAGSTGMPALISRLLVEPELLDALARGELPPLRDRLGAGPDQLAALTALDVRALRHYRRVLQRKRLEMLEPIFPASVPAARERYGFDALATGFWDAYRQPESTPADAQFAELAAAWTGYAGRLADSGAPEWLGELSRYEHLRWNAVFASEPPIVPATPPGLWSTERPVFAPGTAAAAFGFDVPVLLRSLLDGSPVPPPRPTRLVMWCTPAGTGGVLRLGGAAYTALTMCDGDRTVAEIAAAVAAGHPAGASRRVVDLLRTLVDGGALWLTGEPRPAERQDAGPV